MEVPAWINRHHEAIAMNPFIIKPCTHGRGLFASRLIKSGETITKFRGKKIDYSGVLRKRLIDNPLQIGPETYVDIRQPAVIANHSCDPNAGIKEDSVLIAIKDIKPGEEICYDYSTTMDAETEVTFRCDCGQKCRHEILGFEHLPEETKKRYLRLGIVQRFLRD